MAARRTAAAGNPGRARDGVDEHAFQRALAQLAEEQAHQEVLLECRGRREQIPQSLLARRADPGPAIAAISAKARSTSRRVSRG